MNKICQILTLLSVFVFVGCTHKDITCPYGKTGRVHLSFEWDRASEANPAGMTIYFYPLEVDGQMWRFDISGMDGGEVELPIGRYRMLAVNNDLPGIVFSGQSDYTSLSAEVVESGERYVKPTGMLYGGKIEELEVTPCGVSYLTEGGTLKECHNGIVRCWPDSMSTVYTVNVEDIEGIEMVRSLSVVLEGVASKKCICTSEAEGTAALLTSCAMNTGLRDAVRTITTGLGASPGVRDFILTLRGVKTDGKNFKKSYNVTDQVANSPNPLNVLIRDIQ